MRHLAEELGIPATIEKADVPQVQRTLRLSPEEAARLVRYEFLDRVADEAGALRIALGHTADDQVETVLYRLAASHGRRALLGMRPRDGRLVRPLLGVWRAATEAWCADHGLAWREDPSNASDAFARNRARHGLVPALRALHPLSLIHI